MKKVVTFLAFGLLFTPNLTLADVGVCSKNGYTVATINGVFTDAQGAGDNLLALKKKFGTTWNNQSIDYQYLLNPSHLAGLGDGLKAFKQKVEDGISSDDYDLIEMIKEASAKVTTQKLLLVAHSQGNFYANSFYDKVAGKDGGVPLESIGMYSVATPSNHVAGNGKYLTSGTDKVISGVVGSLPFLKIMSPNTYIELKDGDDPLGHNFAEVYLKYKPVEIVSDIAWSLDRLQTSKDLDSRLRGNDSPQGLCIDPPKLSLAHKIEGAVLTVADPIADVTIIKTPQVIHYGGLAVLETGTKVVTGIGNVTTQGVALTASGISAIGNGVGTVAGGTVKLAVNAGKFVGKTVAGVFTSDGEQVAGVAKAIGSELTVGREDIGNTVEINGNTESTSAEITNNQDTITKTEDNTQIQAKTPTLESDSSRRREEIQTTQVEVPVILAVETKKEEVKVPVVPPPAPVPVPTPPATRSSATTPTTQSSSEQTASVVSAVQNLNEQAPIRRSGRVDRTAPDAPVVTSPTADATFTTTSVTFSGSAEDGSTISSDFSGATVTADGEAWSLPLTLGQGTTTIQFYSTDTAGNVSEPASLSVFVDSLSPDVTLTSSTCTGTLSSSACLVATTTLAFSWSGSASDISYFRLDRNGTFSTTTGTSFSVTGTDESTYTFKVASVDTHGNSSATSTQAIEVFTQPVVVNEVAWAGTSASFADEWVELYNRTSRALSLSTFVFYASDNSPYIPLSGTIAAGGYYLIERDDNNTVSTVSADLVANFGSGLNNSGESLILAVASSTIDTVATCSGGGTSWCAGSDTNYTTIERYDASVSGSLSSNWSSNRLVIYNGKDANNMNIYGTPRARNNASYYISLSTGLSSDKTLTTANSPYLISSSVFTVASGVTLTIDPGVVIKITSANEPWLLVQGAIKSNGTSANPVVFTSFYDDDYGGDMNGDGTATTPSAGNWRRILIDTTSTGSSFTNTLVRYGGNNNDSDTTAKKGSIGVDTATVSFDGLVVEKSNYYGLALQNSNSTVTNSRFSTSTNSTSGSTGLYISGGSPTISNSIFSGNYRGVSISGATPTFTSNTFTSNSQEAILNSGLAGSFSGNSGTGNGMNAIFFLSSTITANGATTTLLANDLSYVLQGSATLATNSTLSFATGVVVKGWDSAQSNYGLITVPSAATLHFAGTAVGDLVFTGMYDSTVGSAVVSGGRAPISGDWRGILVSAGGKVHMSGFTMKYAGAEAMFFPPMNSIYKGAIQIAGSTATSSGSISNALFDSNYQSGLNLSSVSALTVSDVTFQNHTQKNSGTASGLYSLTSTSTLSNITFSGNTKDAIGSGVNALTCTNCGSPDTTPSNLFVP